jgi:hypothetical protein
MRISMHQNLLRLQNYLSESSWFAYVTIMLLQVKVMLRIWQYRDLAPGDTSYYYVEVFRWLNEGRIDIVSSPIYTLFLAALHRLMDNPFRVLLVARMSIAIGASLLILALMRRLLPKHIAWIIAAWWALLPINFDTVYQVHLFSALFLLALFVIAASTNSMYGRGIILAGLLLTAVLVRFEYAALFLLWLFALVGYEIYLSRRRERFFSFKRCSAAYGLPMLAVFLLIGIFYGKSAFDYTGIKGNIAAKQHLTLCQVYAYNAKQHGDSWRGNPWTDCQDLMERDFGRPAVTLSQAIFLNPGAILRHSQWNMKLIPSGMQLALFNYYAGGLNPDYVRAGRSPLVWAPFLLVMGLSAFAAIRYFILPGLRKHRSIENKFVWLLMSSAALLSLGIMAVQRPRPSYMFLFTVFIMALSGLGLQGLLEGLRMDKTVKAWALPAGILLILLAPAYYDADYVNPFGYRGQPLRRIYQRIAPYIDSPAVIITRAGDYTDLSNYLDANFIKLVRMDRAAPDRLMKAVFTEVEDYSEENVYLLYREKMIDNFVPSSSGKASGFMRYVQLNCFSLIDNVMRCSDGEIDLARGLMNDGNVDVPLRAVLFVNDGFVIDRKDFRTDQGYYLQVLMKKNKIYMILAADDRLFKTYFNRRFLLGDYDRRYFEEVYNDFPAVRILKVKREETVNRKP